MKYLFTPFLFLLTFHCLQAQDSLVTYKNDIGFNTTFALQSFISSRTPFSLMYKKYIAERKAWRLGVDTRVYINKTDSKTSTSTFSDYSPAYLGLVIGMEKQHQLDKRWVWFYGGDFVPYYSFTNTDSFANGELYWEEETKEFGLGMRPFLGIRFDINARLYLSAEANILLSYARTKNFASNVNDPVPTRDIEGATFIVTASPASGLFLYYRF